MSFFMFNDMDHVLEERLCRDTKVVAWSVLDRDSRPQNISKSCYGFINRGSMKFFFFPRRPPSTVSLRWKALTQTGLRAALWPFLNSCLALRRVREEANACFTCVSTPSLVLESHPGFLFPSITWRQTRHFISVFSPRAEMSRRDSSGEDERRPTWLTYQWRVRCIPSARSVTPKWSWQHTAPNPPQCSKRYFQY